MKLMVINGSPRKNWNTGMLLKSAMDGAGAHGSETRLVHLYELNYKGCISCFSCKLKNGKNYGRCSLSDDLTPVLRDIEECDSLLIGSPIYFGDVTGELRSFLERLLFQYLEYNRQRSSTFKKRIRCGFIYTMNAGEDQAEIYKEVIFSRMEGVMRRFLGETRSIYATETLQFDDYSLYVSDAFDPEARLRRRKEEFPKDCSKAFELGEWLAGE